MVGYGSVCLSVRLCHTCMRISISLCSGGTWVTTDSTIERRLSWRMAGVWVSKPAAQIGLFRLSACVLGDVPTCVRGYVAQHTCVRGYVVQHTHVYVCGYVAQHTCVHIWVCITHIRIAQICLICGHKSNHIKFVEALVKVICTYTCSFAFS